MSVFIAKDTENVIPVVSLCQFLVLCNELAESAGRLVLRCFTHIYIAPSAQQTLLIKCTELRTGKGTQE